MNPSKVTLIHLIFTCLATLCLFGVTSQAQEHYVGGGREGEISADYYGMFADRMAEMLGADRRDPPFVAMMSNGTSGDINNINFRTAHARLPPYARMSLVANLLAAETYKVLQNIQYHDWISLDAEQKEIPLGVRRPTIKEVRRAKDIMSKAKGLA